MARAYIGLVASRKPDPNRTQGEYSSKDGVLDPDTSGLDARVLASGLVSYFANEGGIVLLEYPLRPEKLQGRQFDAGFHVVFNGEIGEAIDRVLRRIEISNNRFASMPADDRSVDRTVRADVLRFD
tara:strand:- start:245 stop:622 length:378 start_codon:yes stop_codon:yes gene_type:complete